MCIDVPFKNQTVELCRTNRGQLTTQANDGNLEYTPFYARKMQYENDTLIIADNDGVHLFTIDNTSNKSLMYSIKEKSSIRVTKDTDKIVVREGNFMFDFNNHTYKIQPDGSLCIQPSSFIFKVAVILNFIWCIIIMMIAKHKKIFQQVENLTVTNLDAK